MKTTTMVITASLDPEAAEDVSVERRRPGAAPSAFRIFRAGENPTTKGMAIFSERSAALLMDQQAERGVLYPVDMEHGSLRHDLPLEARRAVGWHRLAVRPDAAGNLELWAEAVEWDATVRAGLERQPPAWRYISPVFFFDDATFEVIEYFNLAVTNTPATHHGTQIAASRGALGEGRISTAVATLRDVASDATAAPQVRADARHALERLARTSEGRAQAVAALARVRQQEQIDRAARVAPRGGIVHDGTRLVLHTMTPAEARAELARRECMEAEPPGATMVAATHRGIVHDGTRLVLHTMTPAAARRELARREKSGGAR